jgi:hypothetical protein
VPPTAAAPFLQALEQLAPREGAKP